ncbi:MAG: multidrug effflux MFS transporter [Pararhodobacter sp.]
MTGPTKALPFPEFIALLALLMATVAYSVDAMLPLLDPIGAELSPDSPESGHLVIMVFMMGLGLGTFIMGPLSDALGRKTVILGGIMLYMVGAVVAALSGDMTTLLVARFVQGFGASAPRVVSQAMVRDLYAGRQMAKVISFAMTVFVLFPAVAPFMGAQLAAIFDWRAIFWSFVVFGTVSALWLGLRQPETLPQERRRPLALMPLWAALKTVLAHPRVRLYVAALTCVFTSMLIWLGAVATIFEQSFARGAEFPAWFALVAVLSAPASLINGKVVVRLGMRRLVGLALGVQIGFVAVALTAFMLDLGGFVLFLIFMGLQFFSIGFLIGNLNALALEPMGHVAGMAASVVGGISTVVSALLAAALAMLGDGTPVPLAAVVLGSTIAAAGFMLWARRYAEA